MKTLHVIDVENIFGGPFQGEALYNNCKELYQQIINIHREDEVLLASNPELFMNLLHSWAYDSETDEWIGDFSTSDLFNLNSEISFGDTLSIFSRPGKDGADRILRERALTKLEKYDRIIVASGDHYFLALCNKVLELRKKLVIISTQHGFSTALRTIPCEKITFEITSRENKEKFSFKWKSKIGAMT
ncbi:MAG: hypothetical protein CL470_08055 [Acidimicrobiaceae bacterium]|nr:hypothetical protein [Acidimicrobiaceae bacterium]